MMVPKTAWKALCRFSESKEAKVLRDLYVPAIAVSSIVAFLWALVWGVLPYFCDVLSFFRHNPIWLIPAWPAAVIGMCIVRAILGAITGGGCSTMYPGYGDLSEYQNQVVARCNGGLATRFRDNLDCVRIDQFDKCFRTEPCVGLSLDHQGYVNPLPKLAPCPDILDGNGFLAQQYEGFRCIELDPCEPCYRPAPC